jgi:uncharacterized metal-binding protein
MAPAFVRSVSLPPEHAGTHVAYFDIGVTMRFALPILNDRISPRPTSACELALVDRGSIDRRVEHIELDEPSLADLLTLLKRDEVDFLVCCGIDRSTKEEMIHSGIEVIENVACSEAEAVEAIFEDRLKSGFGLYQNEAPSSVSVSTPDDPSLYIDNRTHSPKRDPNCLILNGKSCAGEKNCPLNRLIGSEDTSWSNPMMEAALDVAMEKERNLCRLSEVIYFCLEMKYKTVGLAFCSELDEPARIAASVLKRFFNVIGVCCKVGLDGALAPEADEKRQRTEVDGQRPCTCNPLGQAQVLNRAKCDVVIMIGLCVGSDCILTKACKAPVTALFVKDKMLANNPIGAVYSKRYLKESLLALSSNLKIARAGEKRRENP